MSGWITIQNMSVKYGLNEADMNKLAKERKITSLRLGRQLYIDEDSLQSYFEKHKILDTEQVYLDKLIQEKKEERDSIISEYDDEIFLLKALKGQVILFEIILNELSLLIKDVSTRQVFYSVSKGEKLEDVAKKHNITYDKVCKLYTEGCRILRYKKDTIGKYPKQIASLTLECAKLKSQNLAMRKMINKQAEAELLVNQAEISPEILNTLSKPLEKLNMETKLVNLLKANGMSTVEDLLKYTKEKGFSGLSALKFIGPQTCKILVRELCLEGIIDEKENSDLYQYINN